jgi:branched-chain amino acid transport system ATP-binding protein
MSGSPLLQARGLHKRFGGLAAIDAVDIAVTQGELHALIGPNGAGKSTLAALLAGALQADAGDILLAGRSVSAAATHQRVALGLARSFQITSIFPQLSALDNVTLAVQASGARHLSLWRAREQALRERAEQCLLQVGLHAQAQRVAAHLAHGEQRKLELALALATGARVLLLDEPMAGLGAHEAQDMVALLARLKGELTMLLIEHDTDAVFRLADRITVLVNGKVIATDAPETIRADAQVRAAYLGDEHAGAA